MYYIVRGMVKRKKIFILISKHENYGFNVFLLAYTMPSWKILNFYRFYKKIIIVSYSLCFVYFINCSVSLIVSIIIITMRSTCYYDVPKCVLYTVVFE